MHATLCDALCIRTHTHRVTSFQRVRIIMCVCYNECLKVIQTQLLVEVRYASVEDVPTTYYTQSSTLHPVIRHLTAHDSSASVTQTICEQQFCCSSPITTPTTDQTIDFHDV